MQRAGGRAGAGRRGRGSHLRVVPGSNSFLNILDHKPEQVLVVLNDGCPMFRYSVAGGPGPVLRQSRQGNCNIYFGCCDDVCLASPIPVIGQVVGMEGANFRNRVRRVSVLLCSVSAFALTLAYLDSEDSSSYTTLSDYASEAASIISSSYSQSDFISKSGAAVTGHTGSGLLEVIIFG